MIDLVLKLLGVGQGASVANNAGGLSNFAVLASLGVWAWADWDAVLSVEASRGAWFMAAAAAFFVLEVLRRSKGPGAP